LGRFHARHTLPLFLFMQEEIPEKAHFLRSSSFARAHSLGLTAVFLRSASAGRALTAG
jgi:hypothetical protein